MLDCLRSIIREWGIVSTLALIRSEVSMVNIEEAIKESSFYHFFKASFQAGIIFKKKSLEILFMNGAALRICEEALAKMEAPLITHVFPGIDVLQLHTQELHYAFDTSEKTVKVDVFSFPDQEAFGVLMFHADVELPWMKKNLVPEELLERLRMSVSAANMGIWEYDVAKELMFIAEGDLTFDAEGMHFNRVISNREYLALIHPEDYPRVVQELLRVQAGEIDSYVIEFREFVSEQNKYEWILSTCKVVNEPNGREAKRLVGVFIRTTEMREMREELLQKNSTLQHHLQKIRDINFELQVAKEQAQQSDRLKTAFLQNMSHEIRTPMNGILGFTQLLEMDKNVNQEQKDNYLNLIKDCGQQLLNIINDVVDISKIETGQMRIQKSSVEINYFLTELYNFFKITKKDSPIRIQEPQMHTKQCIIHTDGDKLRQVFNNLLVNAYRYAQHGEITFGYTANEGMLDFFVKDTGVGIDRKSLHHIFDRFFRAHDKAKVNESGTGLGLSISQGIIELLGGKIRVESKPGVGTTFRFSLPIYEGRQN